VVVEVEGKSRGVSAGGGGGFELGLKPLVYEALSY
jgi:hypothetical protein